MNRRRVDVIHPKPLFDARVGRTCAYIYSSRNEKDFVLFRTSLPLCPAIANAMSPSSRAGRLPRNTTVVAEHGRVECLLVARLCEGAKQSWRDQSVKVRPR